MTFLRAGGLVAVLMAATLVPSHAQFASGVNVVEVYASVTDGRGEPVGGLGRGDFELREDGEQQDISTFTAGRFPLSVAIAVDRSFSMAGERLAAAKSAAQAFLDQLRPDDEAMIIAVGSTVEVLAPLSTDRRAQAAALTRMDAFGTTGLYDAIAAAIGAVQPARGRRALIVLSDGSDRYSSMPSDAALARARAADVLVYPIAFGKTRPAVFAELATLTGGRSYHVEDVRTLPEAMRAIAAVLRQQYLLGYTPRRPIVSGAGEWRGITVTVRKPGLSVRARDGYLAK